MVCQWNCGARWKTLRKIHSHNSTENKS
jgi:hypothetical protein